MNATDMNNEELYPIGDVARRTGLAVSAIRFYADEGIVAPSALNRAGHRLYDVAAIAQLEMIRTLRDLGTGLEEIRRLLAGESTLRYLLAEHLELVERQGRDLLARRAVLRALNKQERPVDLLHRLVTLSDEERERLVDDFWDEVAADLPEEFRDRLRTMRPRLSEDPAPAQLEAWIDLAELLQDSDFRSAVQEHLRTLFTEHPGSAMTASPVQDMIHGPGARVVEQMIAARHSGLAPESAHAQALAGQLVRESGAPLGIEDSPARRERLAQAYQLMAELGSPTDPEYDATHGRYLALVGVINQESPYEPFGEPVDPGELAEWIAAALRASTPR